jgi:hypothetical protein
LSCTFYHTHSEKSLSCAKDCSRHKKKVLLTAWAMVTAGHEALPCAYHGDAGQTFIKNKKINQATARLHPCFAAESARHVVLLRADGAQRR